MSDYGASAVFEEVGSDPYGNWEEDAGFDFELNLNNVPSSSQEFANDILNENEQTEVNVIHELNGAEVTDAEYDDFLEDTFVLPVESAELDDDICEIMDVACDRPHKSEELSDEAMGFITSPKKSTKSRSRCQNLCAK